MPDRDIQLNINTTNDRREVEALRKELAAAKAEAQELAGILSGGGGNAATRAQFGSSLMNISALKGAISSVEGSAVAAPGLSATSAALAGAASGLSVFGQARAGAVRANDPQTVIGLAQSLGLSTAAVGQVFNYNTGAMPFVPGAPNAMQVVAAAMTGHSAVAAGAPVGPYSNLGGGIGAGLPTYAASAIYSGDNAFAGMRAVGAASAFNPGALSAGAIPFNSPANRNAYGPAAPGSLGYNSWLNHQAQLSATRGAASDLSSPNLGVGLPFYALQAVLSGENPWAGARPVAGASHWNPGMSPLFAGPMGPNSSLGGGIGAGLPFYAANAAYSGANPFAGASPIGAASAWNPGMMSPAQQSAAAQQQFRAQMGQMIGAGAVLAGSQALNYQSGLIMNGGADPIGRNNAIAGFAGVAIGGIIGFATHNPLLGLEAGGLAFQGLSAIGGWFGAGEKAANDAKASIFPALTGMDYGARMQNGLAPQMVTRAAALVNRQSFKRGDPLSASEGQIGQTFATAAEGMYAGGMNPTAPGYAAGGMFSPAAYQYFSLARGGGNFSLINTMIRAAGMAIAGMPTGHETIAETYGRRAVNLFGNQAPRIMGAIAPIFGSMPETGGNVADILTRFGAQDTMSYLRLQNEQGIPSVSSDALLSARRGIGAGTRAAELGSLQAVGSGRASMSGFHEEMDAIGNLPGGRSSLAYAHAYAGYRSARAESWTQTDIMQYGLRATQISGALQTIQYMPFNPANIMGFAIQQYQNNRGEIGRINSRLGLHDISEQERLSLTEQRTSLQVQQAQTIGQLSEGWENRLPALSAGRPAFFSRYTSMQLAAYELNRTGSPIRAYGGVNGRQVQRQDQFFSDMGVSPGLSGPYSTTSGFNNDATVGLLRDIRDILRSGGKGGAFGPRPGEARGQVNAMLATGNDDRQTLYNAAN